MKKVRVEDISTQIRGVTYRKGDATNKSAPDSLPVLRATNIVDGQIDLSELVFISKDKVSSNQVLKGNDILIAGSSGSINIVGKAARVHGGIKASFGAFCKVLRPNEKVNPSYFGHFFQTKYYRHIVSNLATGININNLRNEHLNNIEIPLPPLPEQKRIAAILDKADALCQKRRQALASLDDLLQSVFLEMFGDPVMNPRRWEVVRCIDVCDCIVPGRDKPKSFSGDIPWITTEDLIPFGITRSSGKKLGLKKPEIDVVRARVIPKGSVLLTCVGDLGTTSIAGVDMVVNQQLHTFQCTKKVNNRFLAYSIAYQKPYMYRMATSTTVPYMNKTVCNNIPTILPPIDDQECFSKVVKEVEEETKTHKNNLRLLNNLFSALQQQAFRGELSEGATS